MRSNELINGHPLARLLLATWSVIFVAESTRAVDISWTRTSLDLFGDSIGVAVSKDGHFFASDGFAIDRSVNEGKAWQQVTSGATFAGGAIAIDPVDSNIMYSGRSHGLLKSVDGGANWFELADLNAGPAANSIIIDPSSHLRVFAGVGAGWGVYRSLNGGASWSNVLSSRDVVAMALDLFNPQIIFAATTDYYSTAGGLLRSDDGGATWDSVFADTSIKSLVIDPSNASNVFFGTAEGEIFKSYDGGLTWTNKSGPSIVAPIEELIVHPADSRYMFAGTSGQGVFLSSNHGDSWIAVNSSLTDLNVVALAIQDSSPYRLFAATYGGQGYFTLTVPEPDSMYLVGFCAATILATGVRRSDDILNQKL